MNKKIIYGVLLGCFITNTSIFAKDSTRCYGYLTEMVRSSNFPIRDVGKDKLNLLIDDDQPTAINAQVVYDVLPEPDHPKSMVPVGWIKYDINNHILWNNSADLNEHPEKLSFDHRYIAKFDQCRSGKY